MYSTPNSILLTPKPCDMCLLLIIDSFFTNSSIDFHFHMLVIDTAFATRFFRASLMACTALGAKRSLAGKTPIHHKFLFTMVPCWIHLEYRSFRLLYDLLEYILNYRCCFPSCIPRTSDRISRFTQIGALLIGAACMHVTATYRRNVPSLPYKVRLLHNPKTF